MALQFLYSSWWENDVEHTIRLASEKLGDSDIDYIMRIVSVTDRYDVLPDDDENEELANTLYLRLPSSASAIVRTGWYEVPDSNQKDNVIVHAYVQEEGEEVSPMLYAINNCFRIALTKEEQAHLLALEHLPETPFPRPQFKLSQAEIRKFFSQGRLRTLACLLQAVIDAHGNQRIILLKDSYHSLKYWFYGIHSCLPQNRTEYLTYSTYAFHKPEDCILICPAPGNSIDLDELASEGNFVIDNLDDIGCGDIESANFASLIVKVFWEDATQLSEFLEGMQVLMETYHLNVATAAGLYKLVEFDFEWFKSAHEIHYFLGKVGTIDKDSLEMISHKLWEAFQSPDFKFSLNTDNLPILSYMFRNTDDTVRWEIISYIDGHKEDFGYRFFDSFDEMYADLIEKLSFVTEFIPLALMREKTLIAYCESRDVHAHESATFLNIIVENYNDYVELLGVDAVHEYAIYLFERVLHADALDAAYTICSNALMLPYVFLRYVLVQGILNDANSPDDSLADEQIPLTELNLPDEFVYRIARLFIEKDPSLALELVKNHAREGKYSESTLALYNDLCLSYPKETADFDETLHERAVYADFVTDSIFYKFASLQNATREELTDFFTKYYLTGKDKSRYFETKLLQHMTHQLPVISIETADYFLKLTVASSKQYQQFALFGVLADYLLQQTTIDLFDYYNCDKNEFDKTTEILTQERPALSSSFKALIPLLELSEWLEKEEKICAEKLIRQIAEAHLERFIEDGTVSHDLGVLIIDKLVRLSNEIVKIDLKRLSDEIFVAFYQTEDGRAWICDVWESRVRYAPESLYPLAVNFAALRSEDEHMVSLNRLTDLLFDTLAPKKCREVYPGLLSYVACEDRVAAAMEYLATIYYRKFSVLERPFAASVKKLFGKTK